MIIGADHFTLGDLVKDGVPAKGTHCTDVISFVSLVVKLKHHDICLTAVYTGMLKKVSYKLLGVLFLKTFCSFSATWVMAILSQWIVRLVVCVLTRFTLVMSSIWL